MCEGVWTVRRGAILFVFIVSALLLSALAPVHAQPLVRIGVIDRAQGPLARGARLAARHINDSGGLIGADGGRSQIAIVVTSPDFMQIAAANMRQADVIAVLAASASADLLAALPQLQALAVPVFTTMPGDSLLALASSGLVFRGVAPDMLQSRALAAYLTGRLGASEISTIQLDADSTSSLIGFASALSELGIALSNRFFDGASKDIAAIVEQIAARQPDAVVIYGPPHLTAQSYLQLRAAGFDGIVSYSQAMDPDFRDLVPSDSLPGLILASPWTYSLSDANSQAFLWAYASAYAALPEADSAAAYDILGLLAAAYRRPGELADGIAALERYDGLQGPLYPAELPRGETSENVVIAELNEFGAAQVVAVYRDGALRATMSAGVEPASPSVPPIVPPSVSSSVTGDASPAGYQLTILSDLQNVRSGPNLESDVIGQLPGGAQAEVIGATEDFSWLLIDFRGQWGWLAAFLVETVGSRDLVPIISSPPSAAASAARDSESSS